MLAPDRPRDVSEVINYVAALNYGLDRLATLPVSVRLIELAACIAGICA